MKLRPFSLVTRLTLVAGIILTGTVLIFGLRSYEAGRERAVTQWEERLDHEAGMAALKVQGFIADVARDARYLARIPSVQEYAGGKSGKGDRQRVEENFRALMQGKPVYAQLRLIGTAEGGREKVRLDQSDGVVRVTPEDQLQQKGDRDYIEESRTLPPGGIYLSDADLNQDFGRVTQPWMPTLRAVTPVLDGQGRPFGWIVINADLRPLLESMQQQTVSGLQLALANDSGSYLLHPDPQFRFGADLQTGFNLLKPVGPEDTLMADQWLAFTGSYEFMPGSPRRFYVRTGSNGEAALADLRGVRNQALLASALTALGGLLLLVLLARLVTRRLRAVATALGEFATGGPAPVLNEQPADEIGQLAAAFNRMSGKIAEQVRTLEEARGRADEASRAKDDFLAVMSHEIRTPLNAVTGMLHVLERNRPAPHQEPILRSLHAAAGQLTSLLNEALDWSKIKAGRLVCDPAPFALGPLLTDLELTHRPLAAQKGLRWFTVLAPQVPEMVTGDRLRLSQVLHNLLSNAVKFTHEGFVRLTVAWQEGWLTCRVEDSGIGIQEADIGRIFSPFDQAHGEIGRRFGGTGLGLSISRSLAELMGGHLNVESRPQDGSCFVLTLPCPAATGVPGPALPAPAAAGVAGAHVLCVEDSAMNREVLGAFLEEAGVTYEMAEDGASALAAIGSGTVFAAALLDLQLPDTNGIALAGRIRALQPNLPLLAVTAQVDEATRQACHTAGMAAVITKPVHPGRLLEALAGCLVPAMPGKTGVPEKAVGEPTPPLLADLFAAEPERLRRVLLALAGEFQSATVELAAAAAVQNHDRLRRLRHKLHSALAGLHLTELDQTFTLLLAGDWSQTAHAGTLLQQAAAECSRRAAE
jgi:signal transduction histidine kinase/DNA-binding response OmpR family regulator